MSDRTQGTVTIHACPTDHDAYRQIAGILEDRGYQKEWAEPVGPLLELGVTYGAHEVHGDESEEIVDEILAIFDWDELKRLTLVAYTDPAYEWLGSLVIYVGDLGKYHAECDAQGQAVFNADQIRTAVLKEEDSMKALDVLLGTQHLLAIQSMRGA